MQISILHCISVSLSEITATAFKCFTFIFKNLYTHTKYLKTLLTKSNTVIVQRERGTRFPSLFIADRLPFPVTEHWRWIHLHGFWQLQCPVVQQLHSCWLCLRCDCAHLWQGIMFSNCTAPDNVYAVTLSRTKPGGFPWV
jgi:hypothetical protein